MTLNRHTSAASLAQLDGTAPAGKRVHVVTFGCQMNQYDSQLVEGRFLGAGYSLSPTLDEADVVLFNTCSVRDHAEERVYSWLGELKRAKAARPDLVIGVMGCMAQRAQDDVFRRAPHVDLVVGTRRFQYLPQLVEELHTRRAERQAPVRERRLLDVELGDDVEVARTGETYSGGLHAFLAVMRGCDLNCTYCIVPTTRGRVMSRPIAALVDEARWLVDQGARAITLLGQTVNSYGEDLPAPGAGARGGRGRQGRPSLADLIDALEDVAGLQRLRLITLHPAYVTEALAESIAASSKMERFLPLPVQSGSDDVLRRMKRGYTTDLYRARVELLHKHVPDIELGTDWIVGFPGETDADFDASEAFLAEMGFGLNYVFKYDPRPGTKAATVDDDVPTDVKKQRNQRLLLAAERAQLTRHEAYLGREVEVFVESESSRWPGWLQGKTRQGQLCSFPGDAELLGTQTKVLVGEASPFGLTGRAVDVGSASR